MTTTSRQNNLLFNQDWKRIYQTFKNADFKSYDFENLRRVIITYLRENYPEDFNDYIESSEYLALIDAIAFMGQSLAFRIDLASRENFIELAENKESVLRLARLLAYNSKRNVSASGLLKFDTISTSENIIDSNGRNLSQQIIIWNDATNPNWFEQFILVLNSAMSDNTEFGRSQGQAVIQGFLSDQYRFRSRFDDVSVFNFSKSVANKRFTFELVSTSFKDSEEFYEESPLPRRELGFVYRQDGQGPGSANTGFFMLLKQGSLELTDFDIEVPTTNEIITVDVPNINDSDVWLWSLDKDRNQQDEWTKVPSLIGNNIVYNNLESNLRNIYNVVTKEQDKIDLIFADGVYGNLPRGSFRTYYRVSSGLEYVITPTEMRGINIAVPYINKEGAAHELTISLGLKYTISNASPSEDIDSIRSRAPAIYYTQNRMVTGEDYNLAPLSSSQDIIKVKSINRTSSGISRNFDILDASGKYSSINVFADDGYIFKEESETRVSFRYANRFEIVNFIKQNVESLLTSDDVYNFYLTKYPKINFSDTGITWSQSTKDVNFSTGYFIDEFGTLLKVGSGYTNNTLKYLFAGSLIKFVSPENKAFKSGQIVDRDESDPDQTDRIWTKAVRISGDGTNDGRGDLETGIGPIIFNEIVPTGAITSRIVPRFVNNLPESLEIQMVNLISNNLNFGLRYDNSDSSWKIITASNLNLVDAFNLGTTGDNSNTNNDSSWIVAFVKEFNEYVLRTRTLEYIFGSLEQNRFYFDVNQKTYDSRTGKTIKDTIKVLGINTDNGRIKPIKKDIFFEISNAIRFEDGYQSAEEIRLSFSDSDDDGIIDNPESFEIIVGEDIDLNYIFFKKEFDRNGNILYRYINNPDNSVISLERSVNTADITRYDNGDLIYFYSSAENRVASVDRNTNSYITQADYKSVLGRTDLKFQYIHNANVDRRIDPSVSNIVDVFLLSRSYDTRFRNWLSGDLEEFPEPPTSEALRISYGEPLNLIKTVSDEIIYHPVSYKILFGSKADSKLRAQFKVVKNPTKSINDNDLKVRIINSINLFFDVSNWDFGDKFYLGELVTYVTNEVAPDISNLVIVPRQPDQQFGSLFEIQSRPDEIFISGATVDDIEIVQSINAAEIRVPAESLVNTTE
jgi:hypothetical protein